MFSLNVILCCALQLSWVLSKQIVELTFDEFLEPVPNDQDQDEKVTIKVYYESLCPDCRTFDAKQLVPVVEKLWPRLDVQPIPYGKANTLNDGNGTYEITCQHGPKECYGNRLHACALDILGNITKSIKFNACMMDSWQKGRGSDDLAADSCGQIMGFSAKPIKKCAKSQRGYDLLEMYGELSRNVGYQFVPYILVNGVQTNGTDLMADVCRAFRRPPRLCEKYVYDVLYIDVQNSK